MFHQREYSRLVLRVPSWSLAALGIAMLGVALATLVRAFFGSFGANLPFAPFFPAILIVSVFAGAAAGVLSMVLSLLVVWWAFIPPGLSFGRPGVTDYGNVMLFLFSASAIVLLSHLYRQALGSLLQREAETRLLVSELNHRSGNSMAVIDSIVRGTIGLNEATAQKISDRIRALARANELISNPVGEHVPLKDVIEAETLAYVGYERLKFNGPATMLGADTARNLAMILHELTTNAVKYGALSNADGHLQISWSENDKMCSLSWTEIDGPAVVTPERTGFGSRMIRACLATIGGAMQAEFRSDGYRCQLTFPTAGQAGQVDATEAYSVHRAGTR